MDKISQKGVSRMMLHNEWSTQEAPKRGLRDPWAHKPDRPIDEEEVISLIQGQKVKGTRLLYREANAAELDEWKKERDEYMRQRDEWIALQMFDAYGYETFLEDCRMYGLTEEFKNSVRPCESHNDSQCSLFCAQYNNCALRDVEGR